MIVAISIRLKRSGRVEGSMSGFMSGAYVGKHCLSIANGTKSPILHYIVDTPTHGGRRIAFPSKLSKLKDTLLEMLLHEQ